MNQPIEKVVIYRNRSEKFIDECLWDYGGVWILIGVVVLSALLAIFGRGK